MPGGRPAITGQLGGPHNGKNENSSINDTSDNDNNNIHDSYKLFRFSMASRLTSRLLFDVEAHAVHATVNKRTARVDRIAWP